MKKLIEKLRLWLLGLLHGERELFPFAFCIHCGQALEWEE